MTNPGIGITIPGEPIGQGRPRAFRMGKGIRLYDPPKSRSWKAAAQDHMREAMGRLFAGPFSGPVEARIRAVFTCPKSDRRKREPVGRRPHGKRPDAENVAKAVLDAATGVLWFDDAQVAVLNVEKVIGAQGEAPCVELSVVPLQ